MKITEYGNNKKPRKMTQIEQIKAEIERLREIGCPLQKGSDYQHGYDEFYTQIKTFIKSLPSEQQSSSLDKFIHTLLETYPTNKNEVPTEALNDYHQGLICGARKTYNWILNSVEYAIKIDAKIVNDEMSGCVVDCELGCLVLEPHTYPIGQKLKIIIIKDEQ